MDISRLRNNSYKLIFGCLILAAVLQLTNTPVLGNDNCQEINIKSFDIKKGRLALTHIVKKQSEICVIDFSTLKVNSVLPLPTGGEAAAWSPDGQTLAYQAKVNGNIDIYTADADGKNNKRLTSSKNQDEFPDWSPDGKSIVFQSTKEGEGSSLYLMSTDGSNQELLPITKRKATTQHLFPKWSPRGSEILFTTNEDWPGWDVALFDLQHRSNMLLTIGNQSLSRPSWDPSGSSFAVVFSTGPNSELWLYQKGENQMRRLVARAGRCMDPAWNDDGEKLFFVGEKTPGLEDYQLFIWEKSKDRIIQAAESRFAIRYPSWTPLPSLSSIRQDIENKLNQENNSSGR